MTDQRPASRFAQGFSGLYRWSVTGIFAFIMLLLSCLSALTTNHLKPTERNMLVGDSPLLNIGVLAAAVLLVFGVSRLKAVQRWSTRVNEDEQLFAKINRILLVILAGCALVWTLCTQLIPRSDQMQLQNIASEFRKQNYRMLYEDGYLNYFSNQDSTALLYMGITAVFGTLNYTVFELINIAMAVLFCRSISTLCGMWGMKNASRLVLQVCYLLFSPLILYCNYLYGLLPGMALSAAAIVQLMRFLRSLKARNAVFCALLITLAIFFKTNCIIQAIAVTIVVLVELVTTHRVKLLILPVMIVALTVLQATVPSLLLRQISGEKADQNASTWTWLAIGLMDEGENSRGSGTYNVIVRNYFNETGYQADAHTKFCKQIVKERLSYFATHRKDALAFFTEKVALTWTQPAFASQYLSRVCSSQIEMPDWAYALLTVEAGAVMDDLLNPVTFVVYAGALMWCILCRRREGFRQSLILPMVVVGGFLFHLVWETKVSYAFPYFMLLFPYAVWGIGAACEKLGALVCGEVKFTRPAKFRASSVCLAALLLMGCCTIAVAYSGGRNAVFNSGAQVYSEYLAKNTNEPVLQEGLYTFRTANKQYLRVSEKDLNSQKGVFIHQKKGNGATVRIINFQGKTWLRTEDGRSSLALWDPADPRSHMRVAVVPNNVGIYCEWKLAKAGANKVYILMEAMEDDSLALTCDPETGEVYLSPFTRAENQKWIWKAVK